VQDLVNIWWVRSDLRLQDNPALLAATTAGARVVPVFIWAPEEEEGWAPGAASRWWLHQSLKRLDEDLRKHGARLILKTGDSLTVLRELAEQTKASSVFWNRRYEPSLLSRECAVREALEAAGINVETFNGNLLYEPTQVKNKEGRPFKVFTPFWNYCLTLPTPAEPAGCPEMISLPSMTIASLPLESFELEPQVDWASGIRDTWNPGECGAHERLRKFVADSLEQYERGRDFPSQDGVSMLSPHLHFGEISPRQICKAINELHARGSGRQSVAVYFKELGWREFAHHILFHFPGTADRPLRSEFERFPWSDNADLLTRWQKGQTGYPIVDAGMRQLWQVGWMHNRVRMIVASFLTKDLLISWHAGAKWFWDTLVDADLANNTMGWQWASGSGADAAPYFRIFNPELQGEKFDPEGEYVRSWVPELSGLSNRWIHKPWKAPPGELRDAGITLGENYPRPIVDHSIARKRALAAFSEIKAKA
jgi:deoxyribodipyrimidine photo-lyase